MSTVLCFASYKIVLQWKITITVKHKTDRESYIDMTTRKSSRAAFFDVFEKSNKQTV